MKHLVHFILYCFSVALSLWLIGFTVFCVYAISLRSESPAVQDAIVVLTGGSQRIDTALDLLKKYKADYMLISGVNKQVTEDVLLKKVPLKQRIKITLGYEAENTVGNAREINQWLGDKKIQSILLVTSFYHMPRSILEISRFNPNLKIAPWPVFPKEFDNSVEWIKTRYAWLLFIEYHKFVYVYFKYLMQNGG